MATSENILLNAISGAINKQIVIRRYGNKTVISAYPDMSNRKLSTKQKRMNELMKKANASAKATIANEQQRNAAQLRLNVPKNKLYISLISEYYRKHLNG